MSLDWNLSKIADYKRVCFVDGADDETGKPCRHMNPVTNALIWATMAVGIGEITEKGHRTFYSRLRLWESATLPLVWRPECDKPGDPRNCITLAEVRAHIGLGTNVGRTETESAWVKRLYGAVLDNADAAERRAAKAAEPAL